MSVLEFLQIAIFTNFPSLAHGAGYRPRVTELVLSLLQVAHSLQLKKFVIVNYSSNGAFLGLASRHFILLMACA